MADAVRFVNENGRVAWQPLADDGDKQWQCDDGMRTTWDTHRPYDSFHYWEPRLYRRRSTAVRKARRQEHHNREKAWRPDDDD